jgi:hypothetical protein
MTACLAEVSGAEQHVDEVKVRFLVVAILLVE